jgi:benzodiazapine receptor
MQFTNPGVAHDRGSATSGAAAS